MKDCTQFIPVAGQGFNLVLRDINKLQEIIKYYTGLGMSLKSTPALEEFTIIENLRILLQV